jgi:hypothetical protein
MTVNGKYYSWKEIYNLCGLCNEDFTYDYAGSYADLVAAIKEIKE